MAIFFRGYKRLAIASICGGIISLNHKGFVKGALAVFVYHDVTSSPSEFSRLFNLYITPKAFRRQIQFIKKHFNVISPKQLLNNDFHPPAALITFDDGFKSYFTDAFSILEQEQVPSINFLNMATIQGEIFWPGLVTYLINKDTAFNVFLRSKLGKFDTKTPLFLLCRKEWVDEYLGLSKPDIYGQVRKFTGSFASEKELLDIEYNPYVFLGNHLYTHEVPLLLTDSEFFSSYQNNKELLKNYNNFCPLFSFPFGQPETCFRRRHLDFLKGKAEFVFSSSCAQRLNICPAPFLLDRVALEEFHHSPPRMWYQIAKGRNSAITVLLKTVFSSMANIK